MIERVGASINQLYLDLVKDFQYLLSHNCKQVYKGQNHGELIELRQVCLQLTYPRKCVLSLPQRNASRRYMAGEFACYLQERRSKEFGYYGSLWNELDVDGEVQSNYGAMMFDPFYDDLGISRYAYAIAQLARSPDSKNAVIMMRDWRSNRKGYEKDRCCTLSVQLFIRENQLDMEVHMRSSDFWFGLPYDIFWYSFVQQRALLALQKVYPNLGMGIMTFQCASLHLYEKHWSKVQSIMLPEHIEHVPGLDYDMPDWTQECEDRLRDLLNWERELRRIGQENKTLPTGSLPDEGLIMGFKRCQLDTAAHALRDAKLPPFLETVGSWLINKINQRYIYAEDAEMLKIAREASKNSNCIDRQVGCVIKSDEEDRIYIGYNKAIQCDKNCADKVNRVCETQHAEIRALELMIGGDGTMKKPRKAWVTLYPCKPCMDALQREGWCEVIVQGFSHKGATGTVTLLDPAFKYKGAICYGVEGRPCI